MSQAIPNQKTETIIFTHATLIDRTGKSDPGLYIQAITLNSENSLYHGVPVYNELFGVGELYHAAGLSDGWVWATFRFPKGDGSTEQIGSMVNAAYCMMLPPMVIAALREKQQRGNIHRTFLSHQAPLQQRYMYGNLYTIYEVKDGEKLRLERGAGCLTVI